MTRYMTPREIAENDEYPFTLYSIRNYLSRRKQNGLDEAVMAANGKLLIDKELFDKWLKDCGAKKNGGNKL